MVLRNLNVVVRVLLLPLIIYFMYQETYISSLLALIFFLGSLSLHYFHKEKKVESFLTPISFKITINVLLFVSVLKGEFWFLPLLAFFIRDVIVGMLRWRASNDDIFMKRNYLSYAFILFQSFTLFGLLFSRIELFSYYQITNQFIVVFTLFTVVFALSSIMQYIFFYSRNIRKIKTKGRTVEHEEMVILANKKSRGFKDRYRKHLLKLFAKRRGAKIIYLPSQKNMYKGIEHKIKRYKHVIIAGGDGSFEGALNYKPFNNKSLGFFPLGAGNAFYSYFYRGKRFEYLRSRFAFHETPFDIVEIEWDGGVIQSTFFSVGTDAEVIRISGKERSRHGLFDYVKSSVIALFSSNANWTLKCHIDQKSYTWKQVVNFTFGKIPYYGYNVRSLLGTMDHDDGFILGMACINIHTVWLNKPLRVWGLFIGAMGVAKPPLFPVKGKEFIIKSDTLMPFQAGGDFVGFTKTLKFRVKRKQNVLTI